MARTPSWGARVVAAWAILAASACGTRRTASVPIPDDVDLVALVFVGRGGTFVSATPLLRLGPDRTIEAELVEGLEDEAFILGYREETLAPLLPDPSVYTSVALRPRRNRETGLPPPDVAFVAPPGSDIGRALNPSQLPLELAADWAAGLCVGVPTGNRLLVDTDCSSSPCLAPPDARLACTGQIQVGCRLTTVDYAFDALGQLDRIELGGESNGETCSPRPGGSDVLRAECPRTACTVDLFTEAEQLGITSQTLQVVDAEFQYLGVLRPPYAGYIRAPIALPDGSARMVSYQGRMSDRSCPEPTPTELLTLRLDDRGVPEIGARRDAPDCLRLLRPAPDGDGWFGAFRDEQARWTWGRFDAQGALIDGVRLTTTATPSLSPTAAGFVVDRWVIAFSDLRSEELRLEEDGNENERASRILSVAADASERVLGPIDLADQEDDEGPVYDILEDSQGAVVVSLDQNEVLRLNRFDLQPTSSERRYRVDARVGVEPEPYLSLMTSRSPEEILFISLSSTNYGEEPNVNNEGVLHLLRDRVAVSDRYYFAEPADPFVLAPWLDRPRSVLVGLGTLDFGARPGETPDVRGLLTRFDLDRPGFAAGAHEVGLGPVTGLSVTDDGQVWGVLGLSGQAFHARLP